MVTIPTTKVAPDGGYGWIIAAACALNFLTVIPIMQGFGLLYKDTFQDLNFTATQIGLILNTSGGLTMLCGLIAGPLLKYLGFRKVSLIGAFLTTTGILLTSHATTFAHFMITYGFITALGMGLGCSAYPVALNTYFTKNRSKASGYTMTIAGLGPVIMPHVISFLLVFYGVTGAMIILGGLATHGFVSAVLLQPVEWHMKEVAEAEDDKTPLEVPDEPKLDAGTPRRQISRQISREVEIEAMYGLDSVFSQSMVSVAASFQRQISTLSANSQLSDTKNKLYEVDENSTEEVQPLKIEHLQQNEVGKAETKKQMSLSGRICKYLVDVFDLTLLKDLVYLNIMFGMSLAIFAEINFSVLTPFIIGEYNLSTQQIAAFMSVLSCTDICFRFLAPYIGDCLNQSHRVLYLFSLLLLIMTRFSLLMTQSYYPLLVVAAGLGVAKGFRTVYSTLVIPSYVPIERLAAAIGIQMAVNGLFIWIGGPAIGFIRDITGSYIKCIYVLNIVTFTAFLMWSAEMLYMRYKKET